MATHTSVELETEALAGTASAGKPGAPRLAHVDGLRAVAVVAVVAFHMRESWLPGGFTGVDTFFTISGYVVMSSLLQCLPTEMKFRSALAFLVSFYARRVKRLAPALVFTVVLAAGAFAVLVPPGLYEVWLSGTAALVGFANIRFALWKAHGGYWADDFGGPRYDPFTHAWSLGVEEQFYLLYPLLVVVTYGGSGGGRRLPVRRPLCLLGGSLLLSLGLSAWLSARDYQLAFYLMPSRWWQLLSGAALAHAENAHAAAWHALLQRAWLMAAADALGLACLVLSLTSTPPGPTSPFPLPWALPACVGTCLLIVSGAPGRPRTRRRLLPSPLPGRLRALLGSRQRTPTLATPIVPALLSHWLPVYIGRGLSYPLYLTHWPVLVLLRRTLPLDGCASPAVAARLLAIALVAAVLLAMVAHHVVEGFFHRWGPRRLRRPCCAAAVLLPALALAVAMLAALAQSARPGPGRLAGPRWLYWRKLAGGGTAGRRTPRYDFNASRALAAAGCLCNAAAGRGLHVPPGVSAGGACAPTVPPCFSLEAFDDWRATLRASAVAPTVGRLFGTSRDAVDAAVVAAASAPDRVGRLLFVLGDSKAGALVPGIVTAVWGSLRVMDWSLPGQFYTDTKAWRGEHPAYVRLATAALSTALRPADVVLVHTRGGSVVRTADNARLQAAQLRVLLRLTRARNASLVLVSDFADFPMDVGPGEPLRGIRCNAAPWSAAAFVACGQPCTMPVSEARADLAVARDALERLTRDEPDVGLLDLEDLFCDEHSCSTLVPGASAIAIGDYKHLTHLGAFYLWPHVRALLRRRDIL